MARPPDERRAAVGTLGALAIVVVPSAVPYGFALAICGLRRAVRARRRDR